MTKQDKIIKQLKADYMLYKMKYISEKRLVDKKNKLLIKIKYASLWTRIKWVFKKVTIDEKENTCL